MIKDRLGKVARRIFYVIFAVLISVALWVFVEITENEVQIRDISGIEVIMRNEEILRDRGLLITENEINAISLRIEASRSDIAALSAPGAFTVEIDLANITSVGNESLAYDYNWPSRVNSDNVVILGRSVARIPLTIGRERERSIPVLANYTGGTASEDFIAEPVEWDPQTVVVRGPENLISEISYVRVHIPRENLSTTLIEYLEFTLYDENSNEIELDELQREQLIFSQNLIRVTVPVKEVKDVALTVELAHGNGTSAENTTVEITPSSIRLSGDPSIIHELNNISLGTIDMSRFGLSFFEEFTIPIPNLVGNISGETVATVIVGTIGLETDFRNVTNIQVTNPPTDFNVEIQTQVLAIMIRGTREELYYITPMNIAVVADLEDIGPGISWVPAIAYLHGVDAAVDVVGEYRIAVSITDTPP